MKLNMGDDLCIYCNLAEGFTQDYPNDVHVTTEEAKAQKVLKTSLYLTLF